MKNTPHIRLGGGGATPALGRLPSCTLPPILSKDGSPLPIMQVLCIPTVSQMRGKSREQPPQALTVARKHCVQGNVF